MLASTNRHQLGAEIFSKKKKERVKPEHLLVDPARHPASMTSAAKHRSSSYGGREVHQQLSEHSW
jgi:hypothetical protein